MHTKEVADRLLAKCIPEPNSGCWLWVAALNNSGYGTLRLPRPHPGQSELAHRISYEIHVGQIPEGLQIDHLCRTRCCVNPDHLEPVTHYENWDRGLAKFVHTSKTHCKEGHPYSGENLYQDKTKRRHCKTCCNMRRRARRARSRNLKR